MPDELVILISIFWNEWKKNKATLSNSPDLVKGCFSEAAFISFFSKRNETCSPNEYYEKISSM